MIKSKYIYSILDLILDVSNIDDSLRSQLQYLTERNFTHTGVGMFVYFEKADGILQYKSDSSESVLTGVTIRSSSLMISAEAMLHLVDGIIDCLEIWSRSGDYPVAPLTDYIIKQEWEGAPGRQVVVV